MADKLMYNIGKLKKEGKVKFNPSTGIYTILSKPFLAPGIKMVNKVEKKVSLKKVLKG